MQQNKGFTLIELLVILAILGILAAITYSAWVRDPNTEVLNAKQAAYQWTDENNVQVKRGPSCFHDSNYDNLASCSLVTTDGEKIFLQCVTFSMRGASGCKEIAGLVID